MPGNDVPAPSCQIYIKPNKSKNNLSQCHIVCVSKKHISPNVPINPQYRETGGENDHIVAKLGHIVALDRTDYVALAGICSCIYLPMPHSLGV